MIVGLHVDATITPNELKELVAETPECGDHLWATDPTAQVVLKLNPSNLIQLVMVNRQGRVMYRGDFPEATEGTLPSYEGLRRMVETALAKS